MKVAMIGVGPNPLNRGFDAERLAEEIAKAERDLVIVGPAPLITKGQLQGLSRLLNKSEEEVLIALEQCFPKHQSLEDIAELERGLTNSMTSLKEPPFVPRSKHQKKSHERPYKFHR